MYDNQRQGLLSYAYIAGIIDGEGAIMITRSTHGNGRKTPSYTPRVKVSMITREPLDFILKHTGMGTINKEVVRHRRPKSRDIWQWQIHSLSNVKKFLELISPYLILKTDQAALMIEYCNKFTVTKTPNYGVPDDVRAYREETYHKMRKLHGRHSAAETKPLDTRESEAIVQP